MTHVADNLRHAEATRPVIAAPEGQRRWRTLDERADDAAFRERLAREFPEGAATWDDEPSRRRFLKLMGASLALAGLPGCGGGEPAEKIVPFVRTPEGAARGATQFYATAAAIDGYATGLLVESHDGRPTKIEGNPDHPESLGATDAVLQAEVLNLYDPDRAETVTTGGTIAAWASFAADLASQLATQRGKRGAGLRILSGPISSPTLLDQRERLLAAFPEARWVEYTAIDRDHVRAGTKRAFGEPLEPVYDLSRADVILSLDADLFGAMPGSVRHTRGWAGRRRRDGKEGEPPRMSRAYTLETTFTTFGASADHRRPVRPGDLPLLARMIARRLGVEVPGGPESLPEGIDETFIAAMAKDLQEYRFEGDEAGGALVVPGDAQPPEMHALAHAMNVALGAVGTTVTYVEPIVAAAGVLPLGELVADMVNRKVDMLVVLSTNPVYEAPRGLDFREALSHVPWKARLGLYEDETSVVCNWHLPATHFLEEWSDARSIDGTASIVQPLIRPLYDGKSVHEVVSLLVDETPRSGYDLVREHWKESLGKEGFEEAWQSTLHEGTLPDTQLEPKSVSLAEGAFAETSARPPGNGFDLVFRPDPHVLDGRYANNGWLQELPRPFTSLTWDNAALLAPGEAERLGLKDGDFVEITLGRSSITLPALRMPGQSPRTVVLHLGFGRKRAGRVGTDVGVDVEWLRPLGNRWFATGAKVTKVAGHRKLALTQTHHLLSMTEPESFAQKSIEARHVVREGTLAEWAEHPDDPHFVHVEHHTVEEHAHGAEQPSFYPIETAKEYEPHEWGMTIDLTRCIGCNACTIACQSENNIPVVGREQVLVGREMHWIRIDQYFEGEPENPTVARQPVACQHCEHAPCEPVCPVAATTHSDEGLNEMTYNRCVGTRYCSNNCPYKVRRFNFLEYNANYGSPELPVLNLLPNPDVTVRSRGVMEKCTYCVQRISGARIDAQIHGDGVIPDGGVVTACQQVCPAEAIVFGNIADPDSAVSRAKASSLDYLLLEEVNTRPRTSYGALVRNPNPSLVGEELHAETSHGH